MLRQVFGGAAIALLVGVSAAPHAQAASLSALEILQQFNVVSLGDMTASSNIQGRTFVGGNLSGNSADFQVRTPSNPSTFGALTVDGDISGGAKNINNAGSAVAAGNLVSGSGLNMNGGGNVTLGGVRQSGANVNLNGGALSENAAVSLPTAEFTNTLITFSAVLKGLGGIAAATENGGNRGLFDAAAPDANGIAVYNVSIGDLGGLNEARLGLNGASAVIINVSGAGNLNFRANNIGSDLTDLADNVIWNFSELDGDLRLERQMFGTVLAPFADVTNTSSVEGSIIAATLALNAQAHQFSFSGPIPPGVPLPPAFAMMGAVALMGAGFAGWRRRRQAA